MKLELAKVHFIGIGGIGMCGLAELLHNMGAQVSGSDLGENVQTERLLSMGVTVYKGHSEDYVVDQDVVVFSSAIPPTNPEFKKARALGIPIIPRAEALAEIMRLKRGIAVGGTHGKTTTTSLVASVFLQADLDPTVVVGGRLDLFKSTAKLGTGQWLIAEADESDGSFNRLSPENIIITNIDNDHLEYYKTFENIKRAFFDFASRIPFYGAAILCGDDPYIKDVFADFPKRKFYYGFSEDCDYRLVGENGAYEIHHQNKKIGEIKMPLPGKHNALNALAAFVSGHIAGIPTETCIAGLEGFKGVDRRFQYKGKKAGVDFYDDYGHHPTEVSAVLSAFKERFPDRRLVVLFQPHRYSRTRDCWSDFVTAFKGVSPLYVLDIYPAGEREIEGVTSSKFCEELGGSEVYYMESKERALEEISRDLKDGDILLTLGAGDVWKLGETLCGASS